MNPFKYGSTVDGEHFCPRPELERKLASYIEAGQNVVIQGERRTGKTSLVLETVRHMRRLGFAPRIATLPALPPDGSRPDARQLDFSAIFG